MHKQWKNTTLWFTIPALLPVVVFLVYPIINGLYLSFFDNAGSFVGLQNYVDTFTDLRVINLLQIPGPPPYGALIHNIIWVIFHLPFTLIFGLGFALLMKRTRGMTIVRTMVFLGMVVPMVVGGILVRFLFSKNSGLIPHVFQQIGVESLHNNWIAHPQTALFALIITSVWLWVGYAMVVYIAGLTTIPTTYYDVAAIEGCSRIQTLRWITIPLLKNSTSVIILMTIIWELKLFDLVYASTGGGPGNATNVMALEMYLTAFKFNNPGKGMAIAVILTLITLIPISFSVRQTLNPQSEVC
jgi:multiple sugar transport system permease protein